MNTVKIYPPTLKYHKELKLILLCDSSWREEASIIIPALIHKAEITRNRCGYQIKKPSISDTPSIKIIKYFIGNLRISR
ncbi:TPA: hypothetical protein DCZ39_07640 [Patescibacteria group bacterium]|nr:hypothetical protein [Candidatus Gracilibacteria bacterium]